VDGLAKCAGYAPAPASLNGAGATVAAVKLVPAWDPLNPDRRDAIYARLSWCLTARAAPCNGTKVLQVNGLFWAWAGWFDTGAFISDPERTSAPAVLSANCSAAAAGVWGDASAERV
jgi:hypothetical protein